MKQRPIYSIVEQNIEASESGTPTAQIGLYIQRNLGRCSYCMRKAFRVSIVGWAATMLIAVANGPSRLLNVAAAGAILLTALWLAHLAVFAGRATTGTGGSRVTSHNQSSERMTVTRRAALPVFARALGFAALASAVPTLTPAQTLFQACMGNCTALWDSCKGQCSHNDLNCKTRCQGARENCYGACGCKYPPPGQYNSGC